MNKLLLGFIFSIFSIQSFAANIKGTVKEQGNGAPLIGVTIAIKNTDKGVQTDMDGKYQISDLPNGTYELTFSYITFASQSHTVTIKNNNDVVLDISLKPEGQELKTVSVKSNRVTHTENAVMMEIRKSNTVVSGISAAQIGKTMDRNAADVVKRIPGVTIQDDRFINIRGLNDRYNTVLLNDAGAPSSEVDKKSFSFDLIPSGLIDRIMIYKTPSPELPGDFAGGTVKIYTTSLPEKNQISVGIQTSSREYSTGSSFNYNKQSSTDWMGYDKGIRNLPVGTPDFINKNDVNISTITKNFDNDWIIYNKKQTPDMRFNFALSNVAKWKRVKIGNTLGVAYSSTSTNYTIRRQDWDSASQIYDYYDQTSVTKSSVGLLDNAAIAIGNSKIEFKNLYNQIGVASLVYRTTDPVADPAASDTISRERSYAMGYESRATYTSQLTGTHKSNDDTRKYTWTLGYTDLFKNAPDLRRIKYKKNDKSLPDSMFSAQVPAGSVDPVNGGGRLYQQLYEHVYTFSHQYTQKIHIGKKYSFDVNLGNYIESKSRSFSSRNIGYTLATIGNGANAARLKRLDINQIFDTANVGGNKLFKLSEATDSSDRYSARNDLIASYASLNLPIGARVRVLGGARYEQNTQSLSSYLNLTKIEPKITTKFLLPSVNATYEFNDKNLLRLAYGKTLNRPEFREWSPFYFYDFENKAGISGSLRPNTVSGLTGDTLKVTQIDNFDLRWEWYPENGEMIHAGLFYKSFKDPIQQVVLPGSGSDSRAYSFTNVEKAYVAGVEIEIRKNLSFADDLLGTHLFRSFTFVGNASLTMSELTIDTTKIKNQLSKTPLQGQSPYVINTGIFFQNKKADWQGSLLYNVFGPRLTLLGIQGSPSIGEMPFQSLDATISKTFFKYYTLSIGIQNLLDQTVVFLQDTNNNNKFEKGIDKEVKSYKPGAYYSVGVKVKFK